MTEFPILLLMAVSVSKGTEMTGEEVKLLERLYNDYSGTVYNRFRYRITSREDAEDLTQHCFLKFAENIKKLVEFDEPQIAGYISATVENALFNYIRKTKAFKFVSLDEVELDAGDESPYSNTERLIESKEDMELFMAAYKKLSEKEQYLLWCRYWMGSSDEEMAELFGIKLSAVRQTVYRVKRRVKKIMKEMED